MKTGPVDTEIALLILKNKEKKKKLRKVKYIALPPSLPSGLKKRTIFQRNQRDKVEVLARTQRQRDCSNMSSTQKIITIVLIYVLSIR